MAYATILNNLEGMDKFLETYNMLRLNQKETENLNRPITSSGIEFVMKKRKLPANKGLGMDGFTDSTNHIKKELSSLLKLLQKT